MKSTDEISYIRKPNFNTLLFTVILAFTIFTVSIEANAQVSITGSVFDEDDSPLPAATVLLLDPADSTMISGNITDNEGVYRFNNINPGNYLVSVSMIGYQPHLTPAFTADYDAIEMGPIILHEAVEQMEEVSVLARRPMFEQQIDRLVVNVQQSITASGSSVLEVLEKSPGLQVNRQNNTISMSGKSGVQVMINDRPVNLPIDAVLQMLNGMSFI